MAVKVRLKRFGNKDNPSYRVVIMDSRSPRDGAVIESIGQYNPMREPLIFTIKEDRLRYWMGVGAQPTDTVKRLVLQHSESVAKEFEKQFKRKFKIKEKRGSHVVESNEQEQSDGSGNAESGN